MLGAIVLRILSEGQFPNVYHQIGNGSEVVLDIAIQKKKIAKRPQEKLRAEARFVWSLIKFCCIFSLFDPHHVSAYHCFNQTRITFFFFRQDTFTEKSFVCDGGFTVQSVVFQLLSYCCKAPSVVSHQTRWYDKRILRKGSSVPLYFLWIENYELGGTLASIKQANRQWFGRICGKNYEVLFIPEQGRDKIKDSSKYEKWNTNIIQHEN